MLYTTRRKVRHENESTDYEVHGDHSSSRPAAWGRQSGGKGEFEGFGANGMSNDWRTWDGTARGAKGFLCDGYYVILAVMAREHKLQELK